MGQGGLRYLETNRRGSRGELVRGEAPGGSIPGLSSCVVL